MFSSGELQIVRNARRIGLDVQINMVTAGDGNCWYRSVIQQMTRPEILALLEPNKIYLDHHALRLAIVNFVREQEPNSPFIQNYHVFYDQTLCKEYNNMSWNEFLSDQEQNRVYCTELFTHATAVFLSIDILVTSETSPVAHPYTRLCRSFEETEFLSPCPMLIGNIGQNHFQSLVPNTQILAINSGSAANHPVDFTINHQSYADVCRRTKTKQKLNKEISDCQNPIACKKVKLNPAPRKMHNIEAEHERSCLEWGVKYVAPCKDEAIKQRKNRRMRLR